MLNKCLLCGGALKESTESVTEKVLGNVFDFQNIPVLKCAGCGEIHFPAAIYRFIEVQIAKKVRPTEE